MSSAALVALLMQAALAQPAPVAAPLAITHVSIVDTEGGPTQMDRLVVLRNGRIDRIEPGTAPLPRGMQVVDGRGKFLIPGLWDMHVHLSYAKASSLPVLIANGVTGVRDLGSNLGEIDTWRTEIIHGIRVGPRIVRAGPMLNGKSFNPYQLAVTETAQARATVRALKWAGVDLIKVHRRTTREAYFAIVDEAARQGLMVAGHIPMSVRPDEASDAGQQIEHAFTLFEGTLLAGHDDSVPKAIDAFLAGGASDSLFTRFMRNHTIVTPTLVPYHQAADTLWPRDPAQRYAARSGREIALKSFPPSAEDLGEARRTDRGLQAVVKRMHKTGVTMMAGTDFSIARPPGFTLHEELTLLVDAGLSPLEALQAATVIPARVMKREADYGSVARGKVADLVLLDASPLSDIRNTHKVSAVIFGGKLYRRAALDSLLDMGAELADKN